MIQVVRTIYDSDCGILHSVNEFYNSSIENFIINNLTPIYKCPIKTREYWSNNLYVRDYGIINDYRIRLKIITI